MYSYAINENILKYKKKKLIYNISKTNQFAM